MKAYETNCPNKPHKKLIRIGEGAEGGVWSGKDSRAGAEEEKGNQHQAGL